MIKKKISFINLFFLFLIFLTNISQMPVLIDRGFSKYLTIFWILFLFLLLQKRLCIPKTGMLIFRYVFSFLILLFLFRIFANVNYFSLSLTNPLFISAFAFFIGILISPYFVRSKNHYWIFYISVLLLTFSIYSQFLINYDWNGLIYVYSSKNSVSQLILTAFFIGILILKPKKPTIKLCVLGLNVFLLIVLFMLRSRASIIGLIIFAFVALKNYKDNIKIKRLLIFSMIIFSLLLIINKPVHNFFIDNILFNNRELTGNLDGITSNRWSMITNFPLLFDNHELFGRSDYYIECFYLNSLLLYGLFLGSMIIAFSLFPLFWIIKNRRENIDIYMLFTSVTVCYLLNGVFEAQAPLGPGVKCYYLWLLFGVLVNMKERKNNKC